VAFRTSFYSRCGETQLYISAREAPTADLTY
jgi:hypothetical protein